MRHNFIGFPSLLEFFEAPKPGYICDSTLEMLKHRRHRLQNGNRNGERDRCEGCGWSWLRAVRVSRGHMI